MDNLTKERRSRIMSKVNTKNTTPELIIRKYLFSHGFRYRVNVRKLPGSPDIVLSKYKTVIFVNGCFWHGHSCRAGRKPQSNKSYWDKKIGDNIIRDHKNIEKLIMLKWKVIVVWQCEINTQVKGKERLEKLINEIKLQ